MLPIFITLLNIQGGSNGNSSGHLRLKSLKCTVFRDSVFETDSAKIPFFFRFFLLLLKAPHQASPKYQTLF